MRRFCIGDVSSFRHDSPRRSYRNAQRRHRPGLRSVLKPVPRSLLSLRMTTATALFNYNDHKIRVVEINGQPWFVAMDVTSILGLTEKSRGYAVQRLDDDERTLYPIQTAQRSVTIISESGLYKLIMRSDKPEARAFQDWVTRIVLPAIRKDGGYIVGEEKEKLQAALAVR